MTSGSFIQYVVPTPSEWWSRYGLREDRYKRLKLDDIDALPEMKSYKRVAKKHGLPVKFKNKSLSWKQLNLYMEGHLPAQQPVSGSAESTSDSPAAQQGVPGCLTLTGVHMGGSRLVRSQSPSSSSLSSVIRMVAPPRPSRSTSSRTRPVLEDGMDTLDGVQQLVLMGDTEALEEIRILMLLHSMALLDMGNSGSESSDHSHNNHSRHDSALAHHDLLNSLFLASPSAPCAKLTMDEFSRLARIPQDRAVGACPICQVDFALRTPIDEKGVGQGSGVAESIIELVCTHCFHGSCLMKWVTESSSTCPTCRKDIVVPKTDIEKK